MFESGCDSNYITVGRNKNRRILLGNVPSTHTALRMLDNFIHIPIGRENFLISNFMNKKNMNKSKHSNKIKVNITIRQKFHIIVLGGHRMCTSEIKNTATLKKRCTFLVCLCHSPLFFQWNDIHLLGFSICHMDGQHITLGNDINLLCYRSTFIWNTCMYNQTCIILNTLQIFNMLV